jgi:outer membrane protein OmpA-like peptidoglycan-associated protein
MEQRLHAVGAELRRTQEQLIASDAAKSASMQQAGTLMLQLQQLQTQLASMTRLKEEADTRTAKLSEDVAAAQHELGQTGQARDAAHKEVKTLTGRFEAAQKELHLVSRARSDLEARASQLRQQLSTTTDNVLDLTEQVRRLQDQLRDGALHQLAVLPTTLRGGISFSHRRTTLTEEAKRLLGQAAAILHQFPAVRLVIEGYTDSQGGKGFNQLLSQHRANAVRDYLIQQGIAHERLVAIGRGEEQPVASNDTPQGRSLNRRIEFRVTRMDGMQEGVGGPPEGEGSSAPVQLELRQPPRGRPVP